MLITTSIEMLLKLRAVLVYKVHSLNTNLIYNTFLKNNLFKFLTDDNI